jgi:HTH-type transcriptional regulator, competence development regulator
MKLGEVLKGARANRDLTLRDVERETGISNGHLSLIESGAVRKPSPNLLEKLAGLYGISYSALLEEAGYRLPDPLQKSAGGEFDDLTPQEREEVRRFVGYLRSNRSAKRGGRR